MTEHTNFRRFFEGRQESSGKLVGGIGSSFGRPGYLGAISGRRIMIPNFRDLLDFFGAMHASGSLFAELCSIRTAVGKERIALGEEEFRFRG